jgi:integrase
VIQAIDLDRRRPIEETTETKLADAIRKRTAKLAKEGYIAAAFSAHDLRHLYAATEYRKDRDIYLFSRLLGHASIQVTETYLRGWVRSRYDSSRVGDYCAERPLRETDMLGYTKIQEAG